MLRVTTSGGFSFVCDEYADAVALADSRYKDSDQKAIVVDELRDEVVYETGN